MKRLFLESIPPAPYLCSRDRCCRRRRRPCGSRQPFRHILLLDDASVLERAQVSVHHSHFCDRHLPHPLELGLLHWLTLRARGRIVLRFPESCRKLSFSPPVRLLHEHLCRCDVVATSPLRAHPQLVRHASIDTSRGESVTLSAQVASTCTGRSSQTRTSRAGKNLATIVPAASPAVQ